MRSVEAMLCKRSATVVAFLAAAALPCEAVRTRTRLSAVDSAPSFNHTVLQVNSLCNSASGEANAVAGWTLTGSGGACACECKLDDCASASCPEGYDPESGVCVRLETEAGQAIPATREEVTCPEGELNIEYGRVYCSVYRDCPPPPRSGSGSMVALKQCDKCDSICECQYDVTCQGEPVEIEDDVAFCTKPAMVTEGEAKRLEVEPIKTCPPGSQLSGGVCRKGIAECPVKIALPVEALACGPNTDVYLERMMGLLAEHGKKYEEEGSSNTKLLSCSSTCVAIYSKVSECAEQNHGPTCVGRAARAGAAIEPIGKFCQPDDTPGAPKWLKRTKKAKELPCKDMYGSEISFAKAGWAGAVSKIEAVAVKHYITLVGTYSKKPTGALDCRKAACGKANSYSQRGAGGSEYRALNHCLSSCAKQYR